MANIGNPYKTYPKGILLKNQDGRRKVVLKRRAPRGQLDLDSQDRNARKPFFTIATRETRSGSNLEEYNNFFKKLSTEPGSKTLNNKGTQRTLDEPMHNLNVSGKDGRPALDLLEEAGFVACRAFDEDGKEEPQQSRKVVIPNQYENIVTRELRLTAQRAGSATPTPSNDQPNEQRGLFSDAAPLRDKFAGT